MSRYGVLTETDIRECMTRSLEADPLFISPLLEEESIGDTTVDLRLGQYFLLQKPSRLSVLDPYELANHTHAENFINDGYATVRVPYGSYFTLHAGQTVRIGSLEYIGLPRDLQGDVTLRHSVSSIPIMASVAKIQPGYRGIVVLTLENHGLRPVLLYPGMRIAQLELRWLARQVESPRTSRYFSSVVPESIRLHQDEEIRFLGPFVDPLIIGIVSNVGAGRTEVVDYLTGKYGFIFFTLTSHLKDIARQQGITPDRVHLQELGTKLRELNGNAYLAEQLRKSRRWIENKHPFVVVDSFKHYAEVEEFGKQDRFYLVGISAPVVVRRERVEDRHTHGARDPEQFDLIDRIDRGIIEDVSSHHQQVEKVMVRADEVIHNDGSIQELYKKLDELVKRAKAFEL